MMNVLRLLIISLLFLSIGTSYSFAQTADELQQKIDAKNTEIQNLEKEIASYQQQITETGKQVGTLQGALQALELARKKLTADIALTQKKIDAVNLTIQSLKNQIGDKEGQISLQKSALEKSIREVSDSDQTSLLEAILTYGNLGDLWNNRAALEELHGAIKDKVNQLTQLKNDLNDSKTETEAKRQELQTLQNQLSDQKKIVEANKQETNKLLLATKNNQANYKKLLADREAKRVAAQQEISNYESQLKLIVDPGSFPHPGSGILSWPVDNPFVTQQFGDTDFSRQNPQAYNGKGHNGIDLRAAPGTPIKAALQGVVLGTGDTDTVCPGASYGKWIMIKHLNGLSTLYAHLSLIKVGVGQNVDTRELIGYSGSTGYATGPHLHFGVYASEGVRITTLKSRVCGGTYTLPVADLKAYLNPLLYL